MAYMCQGCSEEGEVWTGSCPKCGSKQHLNLAPKKADWVGLLVDGRYRIEGKLGQGGMGTVYKAIREGMGQALAIKVLNPEFSNEPEVVRRFLREAKSYGMVQHPNAVNLLDFGQLPDGALYIAMEYIAGKDLSKTILDLKRIPILDAIDIIVQCCDVLGFAHEKGIIHRDLKPENIMMVKGLRSYHAKVLDFGIARLVSDNATQLTVAGTICGTPRYMSPEQARGKEVDLRSDIYSLALVLFEMLTGRQAYTYSSITDLLRAQVTEPIPHVWEVDGIRDIPETLDAVIQKATSKDREERYISMGQFADAVSRALPTVNSMGPFGDPSRPQIDPAGPGRTFLGPGAPGGALSQPGSSPSLAPPIGTGPNLQFDESGATYLPGSLPKLDVLPMGATAPNGTAPRGGTPAPLAPPIANQQTMLKQGQSANGSAILPQKSPSIALFDERPATHAAPASSKMPMVLGGLALLVAVGAVVVPRLTATKAPDVVAVVPVPIARIPDPTPPPVAPTPAPPPGNTQVAVVTPTPSPAPTPNVADPHPRKDGTSRPKDDASRHPKDPTAPGMSDAYWSEKVGHARDEFREGRLTVARSIVTAVDPKSSFAEQAEKLTTEINKVDDLNARAVRFANTGDCTSATELWKEALQLSPGFSSASSGITRCKSAALPTTLDP